MQLVQKFQILTKKINIEVLLVAHYLNPKIDCSKRFRLPKCVLFTLQVYLVVFYFMDPWIVMVLFWGIKALPVKLSIHPFLLTKTHRAMLCVLELDLT